MFGNQVYETMTEGPQLNTTKLWESLRETHGGLWAHSNHISWWTKQHLSSNAGERTGTFTYFKNCVYSWELWDTNPKLGISFILKKWYWKHNRRYLTGILVTNHWITDHCTQTNMRIVQVCQRKRLYVGLQKKLNMLTRNGRTFTCFLDIEKTFDNASIESLIQTSRRIGIDETSCSWIHCKLRKFVYTRIMRETVEARVAKRWSQEG